MPDLDYLALTALTIRSTALVLWLVAGRKIFDHSISPLGRRMTITVIWGGLAAFVIGGLTPFGLPVDLARTVYTAFTAYAAIVALALALE